MAKKKTEAKKEPEMPAVAGKKDIGHARVELDRHDYERLRRLSRSRGLSISAYIRQAVLLAMRADEEKGMS